ncbi:MAG: hypothetical protein ACU4EQ_09120 [Candidatus Nitrosoglobus sp.]
MEEQGKIVKTLEQGNIYFIYRLKVKGKGEERGIRGIDDVQRAYIVLSPHGKECHRLIALGQKRLPEIDDGERIWGFVDKVGRGPKKIEEELQHQTYKTKTRGERIQPAARPAGEGVYALVRHDDHTHLVYALELPKKPGEVQRALNIKEEGSYILSIKNPQASSPPSTSLGEERKADFPKHLQERFQKRRFIAVDPPDFMNYEGAEILFIGAAEGIDHELGIELTPQRESEGTAEIFNELRIECQQSTGASPTEFTPWENNIR